MFSKGKRQGPGEQGYTLDAKGQSAISDVVMCVCVGVYVLMSLYIFTLPCPCTSV